MPRVGRRSRILVAQVTTGLIITGAASAASAQQPATVPRASDGQTRPASFERAEFRTIRFTRQEPRVGDQIDQSLSLELRLNTTVRKGAELVEQNATAMVREQHRLVTTAAVEGDRTTAVRVRYAAARTKSGHGKRAQDLDDDSLTAAAQSVEGRAYECRRAGDQIMVTNQGGDIPPLEEFQIVAENMQSLGQPNPLAEYLAGRTVGIGQQLTLPREVAERLLGIGDSLGQIDKFVLTLEDVRRVDGVPCAFFQANVEAASSDSSQMRLELVGPLVIQIESCRAVQADLVGPIGMIETRGSLDHTYQMAGTGRMAVRIVSTYRDVVR
jgi:hypothetical protein